MLILCSGLGYLEWGGQNSSFLFQTEAGILLKITTDPKSVLHPFIVLPLAGQLLLLFSLFQSSPSKWLTYTGIGMLALLLLFILFIGLLGLNLPVMGSTLPFIIFSVITIRLHQRSHTPAN